jgi:hypothetical protein
VLVLIIDPSGESELACVDLSDSQVDAAAVADVMQGTTGWGT